MRYGLPPLPPLSPLPPLPPLPSLPPVSPLTLTPSKSKGDGPSPALGMQDSRLTNDICSKGENIEEPRATLPGGGPAN